MMASGRSDYLTWGGNKSVRLPDFDYSQHAPYHIIIRSAEHTKPFHQQQLALMACQQLTELFEHLQVYLGGFCLMPDHLHLLCSPDRSGLTVGEIVGQYKGITTNESWRLGWSGRLWQKRFYDHVVRKSEGIRRVAEYIYNNPERKGLSDDYPYRWMERAL